MTAPSGQPIDRALVAALADSAVDALSKTVPPAAAGSSVAAFVADRPPLRGLSLPQLTLDRRALDHNAAMMQRWLAGTGLALAPHGKTTMAPQLWQEQLDAGAWGITLATPAQLKVARHFGVSTVLLANPLLDPAALRWVAGELAPETGSRRPWRLVCWADSVAAVELMDRGLAGGGTGVQPLEVCVELGGPGGRTGCRTVGQARAVAEAIAAAPHLRLAGVAGYEGALAHDAGPAALTKVAGYLRTVAELHAGLGDRYQVNRPIVSVGGSAYFDQVAEVLGPLAGAGTEVVLRSGAYLVHDDGFYADISPLNRTGGADRFVSAMHVWSTVLSRPEPGLAILDAGKRDVSFDEGLPTAQLVHRAGGSVPLPGSRVRAVNDQHLFLELGPDSDLAVGEVVRLGLSHPCTALDRWSTIAVIDDAGAAEPRVLDLIRTYF